MVGRDHKNFFFLSATMRKGNKAREVEESKERLI
jgi:hypothetical protein